MLNWLMIPESTQRKKAILSTIEKSSNLEQKSITIGTGADALLSVIFGYVFQLTVEVSLYKK